MLKYTLLLLPLLIVACNNQKSINNPLQGKWKIYGVEIHSLNADENEGEFLSWKNDKQQIDTLAEWDFRKDNSFGNGKDVSSKGTYSVSTNELYITTKNRIDSYSFKISNDTMYLKNADAVFSYTMKFKKLK